MEQLQGQAIKYMFEISRFKIASVLINPYESRLSLRINQLFLPFTNYAYWRSGASLNQWTKNILGLAFGYGKHITTYPQATYPLAYPKHIMKVYHLFTPASIALTCRFFRLVYEHI